MSDSVLFEHFKVGDQLTATKLNQPLKYLEQLAGKRGPRVRPGNQPADVTEDNPTAVLGGKDTEQWTFDASTTATERLEDAGDSSIYIDMQRTTAITVKRPDGTKVLIQFEG